MTADLAVLPGGEGRGDRDMTRGLCARSRPDHIRLNSIRPPGWIMTTPRSISADAEAEAGLNAGAILKEKLYPPDHRRMALVARAPDDSVVTRRLRGRRRPQCELPHGLATRLLRVLRHICRRRYISFIAVT